MTHRRRTLPGSEVGYEWEGLGTATVVPITRSLAEGGKAAERAVLERVLAALKPMRKEGAAAPPAGQVSRVVCTRGRLARCVPRPGGLGCAGR